MVSSAAAIPPPVARRIDRLSRAAHRFHRLSHHPLCAEYSAEVIRVGRRVRLCRGCTYVVVGAVTGTALAAAPGFAWRPEWIGFALALGLAPATLSLVEASRAKRGFPKLLTRALPAATLGLAFTAGVLGSGDAGLSLATLALILFGALWVGFAARGPDRSPCATCVDRDARPACRGVAPILARERAFQRRAATLLRRAGC